MNIVSEKINTIQFPANVFQLDNGLTVIHQYLSSTPVVVTDVWVKAGAIREPDKWFGMAHFLEHMIFKGTNNIPPGAFDWIIENSGGMTNAATSHDYAHFYITTAADYLPNTLPHFAEILLQAAINDEEFVRERDVVLEEIRCCQDDPDWIGYQAMCETVYGNHPYGRSILGKETDLFDHTPNQMRCFHKTHYQPENITVAIVGGVEQETALSLVNKAFNNFSVRSECPPISLPVLPKLEGINRNHLRLPRIAQARLLMAWTAPGLDSQGNVPFKDAFTLDVISVLLASGRSSRLVKELVEEKHLALDISSDFSLQSHATLFTVSAWLESSNLEVVEELIRERIEQLCRESVGKVELARCQRLLCNDYAFSTETPGQLAGLYGYYHTIARAELSVTYPHYIQQLSPEDIQRVACKYLDSERYGVTVLEPV